MKYKLFVTFFFINSFFACEKNENVKNTVLELAQNEVIFWPEASEKNVEISCNTSVSVESVDSWCKATLISEKSNKVRISVERNAEIGVERSTVVIVRAKEIAKKIKVKQLSETPQITVYQDKIYLNENQTLEFYFDISANLPYSLEIPEWVTEEKKEDTNISTQRHYFSVSKLNQTDSRRNGNISIRFNNSDVENIVIPVEQSNKKSMFSSASYNILVGGWEDRKELIYTIINKHNFDIWGTQEGTMVHLTDILTQFKKYKFTGIGRDGGLNGEFSAILYKTDRFELLEEGSFWYSNTPEKPSYGWDAVNYRRICSWGMFRDKETYNVFYFFNSHFDHQGVIARNESAKLLMSRIKEIVKHQYPILASGDFNCQPDTEPISILKANGLLFDARDIADNPQGSEGTFNHLKPFETSKDRIDYIFISKDIELLQYRVINDRPNERCPSDHDPVMIITKF